MKICFTLLSLWLWGLSFTLAQDIRERVNDYVASYVNTSDFNGCVLVAQNNNTVFNDCFGFAEYAFQIPNTAHTRFKIGSISKQFTAAALLVMEQQGFLTIDDTISAYFPEFPNARKITIQQLLTHTSGVPDIYSLQGFNTFSCQKRSISELADLLLEADLTFESGAQYQYSNGGYAVLAEIIERVSGHTFQHFLKENIFDPLKMTSTGHSQRNEVVDYLAVGYDPLGYDEVMVTDYLDPELLKGSGSLYSTTADLVIWINSIKNRSLLTDASYEKLLTNYSNNYGLGISLYKSFDQQVFGHDGRVNGYIADYLHYEEPNISIVVLGNIQTGVADFFRRDIAAIMLSKEYESRAKEIPPGPAATVNKEMYLGTYAFGPNFDVYVEDIDGRLQARANEGGYSELVLLEDQRFFSRTLYAYIQFMSDDLGMIDKMIWTNNDGNSFEGIKQ